MIVLIIHYKFLYNNNIKLKIKVLKKIILLEKLKNYSYLENYNRYKIIYYLYILIYS